MDRIRRCLMFPLLAAVGACASATASSPPVVFGTPTTYAIGDSRTYDDGLSVTLDRIGDSRCKDGMQCIWAGELAPELTLRGGRLAAPQTVFLGTSRTGRTQVGDYGLVLDAATETTATLTITREHVVPKP